MSDDGCIRGGIPYSLREARGVVREHRMDGYHRELMQWLIDRAALTEVVFYPFDDAASAALRDREIPDSTIFNAGRIAGALVARKVGISLDTGGVVVEFEPEAARRIADRPPSVVAMPTVRDGADKRVCPKCQRISYHFERCQNLECGYSPTDPAPAAQPCGCAIGSEHSLGCKRCLLCGAADRDTCGHFPGKL